ncbi:MAG TPA: four-carbon acid sugar kinase family protein, partial [Acetobacteraceae bacterium]|nr:four-carbon acid sugar kinase family protein [Acetobacteraceae bacterium]
MTGTAGLPPGPLIAFYGDDFTGSTDAMEVLAFAGLPTILLLDLPDAATLARFADRRGIGIAGTARSRSPDWMRENLPPVFRALDGVHAPVLQYKVCSTFDSSPAIGSIGRALEIGAAVTRQDWCAMVVAAPALRRYQAFGNLFASVDGVAHRLDQHPTMARHPVTPMAEADLRRHLAAQTATPVALVDLVALKQGGGAAAIDAARAAGTRTVLFDVIDDETLAETGRLIWEGRGRGVLAIASSGLEYALIAHWRRAGLLPPAAPPAPAAPVERLLVISGSCSPVTARQIAWAEANGFAPIRLDVAAAIDPARAPAEVARTADIACTTLAEGRDAIVFSARGPDDPATGALREAAARSGEPVEALQRRVAHTLGAVLARALPRAGVTRVAVAGGDTSGEVTQALGVAALEAIAPVVPGAPLCRGYRRDGG